jgi:hypothetical protein
MTAMSSKLHAIFPAEDPFIYFKPARCTREGKAASRACGKLLEKYYKLCEQLSPSESSPMQDRKKRKQAKTEESKRRRNMEPETLQIGIYNNYYIFKKMIYINEY